MPVAGVAKTSGWSQKEIAMTPIGHSLLGLTFATFALPLDAKPTDRILRSGGIAFTFVALANLPDWPLPSWGHDKYYLSHSLFVNAGLICVVIAAVRVFASKNWFGSWRFLGLAAMAWLSHLLLDSFYNHGRGIAIFWPVSKSRLNLAMPWFANFDLSQPIFCSHNLAVFGIEFIAYAPILLAAIAISNKLRERKQRLQHEI